MLTCFDVADYFLAHCDEESGDIISNLKNSEVDVLCPRVFSGSSG